MKNILFVVNKEIISPNENGGASVYFSHLELLKKLGYSIHLLFLDWDAKTNVNINEIEPFTDTIIYFKIEKIKPKKGLKRLYNAIFNPAIFEYYFLTPNNKVQFLEYLTNLKIDIIWAEWRWAGILVMYCKSNIPAIYIHHDWEYKLAKLRSKNGLLKKFHTFQKKRVEYQLVRSVAGCISGSFTEANEITKISKKIALYMPTTYAPLDIKEITKDEISLVHLGSMGTTANRVGLERFLDVCWEEIKKESPKIRLKVIGKINNAQNTLKEKLKDPNINCLEYVKNLESVMKPFDIHIIPWEHNTGTRTRIPVVLNFKQILIATRQSVACYPELIDKKNAILVESLTDMKYKIIDALNHKKESLMKIAEAGKKTFEENYTIESQQNKLKNYLNSLLH